MRRIGSWFAGMHMAGWECHDQSYLQPHFRLSAHGTDPAESATLPKVKGAVKVGRIHRLLFCLMIACFFPESSFSAQVQTTRVRD